MKKYSENTEDNPINIDFDDSKQYLNLAMVINEEPYPNIPLIF
jgi:hypothetical protein